MKIGILGERSSRAILEHTKDCVLGISDSVDGIMVEKVLMETPEGIPAINTCNGAKILEVDSKIYSSFCSQVGITNTKPDSFLYGFLSPTQESQLIEFVMSDRFMNEDVGPRCGFVQGCALPVGSEVNQAFPKLGLLFDMLHQIQYCGEITIGVNRRYEICSVTFGHCTGAFSLYTELAKQSPQHTLEFAFGKYRKAELHENRVAVTTVLSYPPYPYDGTQPFSIIAPRQAERHLYRFNSGMAELAYAAAAGAQVFEARRRLRRTFVNCKNYQDDLQHRTDAGKFCKFTLAQDQYKEKGGYE